MSAPWALSHGESPLPPPPSKGPREMVFALGSRSETLRSGGELAPYRHSCCLALVPRLGISSPSTEPYQEKPLSVTHAHRKLTVHPAPQPDELLSSYVIRIARAHRARPRPFWKAAAGVSRLLEVDFEPPPSLIAVLVDHVGIDP